MGDRVCTKQNLVLPHLPTKVGAKFVEAVPCLLWHSCAPSLCAAAEASACLGPWAPLCPPGQAWRSVLLVRSAGAVLVFALPCAELLRPSQKRWAKFRVCCEFFYLIMLAFIYRLASVLCTRPCTYTRV